MQSHMLRRAVFTLGMILITAPALAETAAPGASPPVMEELDRLTQPERGPVEKEESGRHFEAKKRERLLQALQLDDATRAQLSQRLQQLDQKAEDLRRQRKEALLALRDQAKGLRKDMRRGARNGDRPGTVEPGVAPVDPSALKESLNRLYAVEEAMVGLRRDRFQAGRDLLTPEQQLKFLLFSMKFHKEMRERLEREHAGRESPLPGH